MRNVPALLAGTGLFLGVLVVRASRIGGAVDETATEGLAAKPGSAAPQMPLR